MLVLQFSGVLSAGTADNAGAYKLASVIKVKASGKGKNRKPATNKLGSPVPVASAVYSASDDEVILAPRTKLTASKPGELIVNGTLITDTLGREIDGADDGVAGSDYVATISGTRATPGGLPMARTLEQVANVRDAVDTLLDRGELAGIARSPQLAEKGSASRPSVTGRSLRSGARGNLSFHELGDLTVDPTSNIVRSVVFDIFRPAELARPLSVWKLASRVGVKERGAIQSDLFVIGLQAAIVAVLEAE